MEQDVLNKIIRRNTWWSTGEVSKNRLREYRRQIFTNLLEALPNKRIISLSGLRRVGKTTLMYQLVDHLLKKGTLAEDILFISFDELLSADNNTFDEIFEWYSTKILEGKEKERIYIFIDEIHFLPDWDRILKSYCDNHPEIKFIISGSASIKLKKGYRESLAGRIDEVLIPPFMFAEVAGLMNINLPEIDYTNIEGAYAKMPETDKIKLKALFEKYISFGGMPEAYIEEYSLDLWQEYLENDVIKRIVYEDLAGAYSIRRPGRLVKLLKYFAYNISGYYEPTNIGKTLSMDRDMVEYYLNYLMQTSLVFLSPRYGREELKSMEKMYLGDVGIRNAIIGSEADGTVIENIVFLHLLPLKPAYWKNKREVDFVIKEGGENTAIECKHSNRVEEKDVSGLRDFMEKHGCSKAIVLTKNQLKADHKNNKTILYLPTWFFLLIPAKKLREFQRK